MRFSTSGVQTSMRPETAPWWRQAQADLVTGRQTLQLGRYYAASWFAQQAAEKGLKALFIERRGALAPRTHDLEYLGRQVSAAPAVAADLVSLNVAFDLTRYPEPTGGQAPVDSVTPTQAGQHLAAAERILAWLDTQLNPPSSRP